MFFFFLKTRERNKFFYTDKRDRIKKSTLENMSKLCEIPRKCFLGKIND